MSVIQWALAEAEGCHWLCVWIGKQKAGNKLLGMESIKVLLKIKVHSTRKLLVEEESTIV